MPCSPPTIPLPAQTMPQMRLPPFPEPHRGSGVSGGPVVAVVALLVGAAALGAVAFFGPGPWPDWWILGGLALVAGTVYALLWAALVRPIRRFGEATSRLLAEDRVDLVPRSRASELDRVAVALYRFRRIRPGRRGARSRRRVPMAVAPCLAIALVLGWAVPAAVATVRGAAAHTDAVVSRMAIGVAGRAQELHEALNGGLVAVERAADPPTGAAVAGPGTTAAQVLAAEPLFRSVSVVDASGEPIASAGAPSTVPPVAPPPDARVVQVNTAGSEPLVRASAPMWDGGSALVAEFDPRALNGVVRADDLHTRVLDARQATVLDSAGYTAFSPLDDPALGGFVGTAAAGAPAAGTPEEGRVAAAQVVSPPGSATDLGWVLVEDQDVATAAFAGDVTRRAALVAVAATAAVAIAALLWTMVTVVAPARRLARHAEQLAAGESLVPLAPQRLDEIGTAVEATNRLAARLPARAVAHA